MTIHILNNSGIQILKSVCGLVIVFYNKTRDQRELWIFEKRHFSPFNTIIVKLWCKGVQISDRCCILNCSSFSLGKHGGYSKYEVTPPPQQQQQQQQDYDERKQHDQRGGDQGGYGPRKQVCNKSLALFQNSDLNVPVFKY